MGVRVISRDGVHERNAEVARRLVDLTRRLVEGQDLSDPLHELVMTLSDLVPSLEAGILLKDDQGALHVVASTSESARLAELVQLQNRMDGPCLECLRTGRRVSVNVDDDTRWVPFTRVAKRLGFQQIHSLPMHLRDEVVGSLNLFAGGGGRFTPPDLELGAALADLATHSIGTRRTMTKAKVESEQLRRALESRVVIEQAKGRLAEAGSIQVGAAFGRLRDYCRDNHLSIHATASAIVRGSLAPEQVLARRSPGRVDGGTEDGPPER